MNSNNNESINIATLVQLRDEYTYKHRPRDETTIWRYQEGRYNSKPKDPLYHKGIMQQN